MENSEKKKEINSSVKMKPLSQKQRERMQELCGILDEAGRAYYQEAREIMSNREYDQLYDELVALEKESGVILAGSPTVKVGYEVLSELPKETHESPMLSLDKTKEVEGLKEFLGEKEGVLSWKLDGLTVVLTYRQGKLEKAVTRGNGEIGEIITNNAKTFVNLPHIIPYQGELVIRGEAIIKYSDFEKLNAGMPESQMTYKNPRNLCSGSVRQLNNEITAKRSVNFYAFSLIKAQGVDFENSLSRQFSWLEEQGFQVVEHYMVNADQVEERVSFFEEKIKTYDLPSDGLVLIFEDIAYGLSLGRTAKFPRNGIAFKWADELAQTTLREIEWSPSRTGLINPVAIFEPVELEGTTVSRASVHNISIMEELKLGIGDKITVYKANMIIPQIHENLTRSNQLPIAHSCPACGEKTEIRNENDVKYLYCPNEQCPAKIIKSFTHFVGRDAMNVDGLSEETLEKFIQQGYIHEYGDLFHLDRYEDEIVGMKGFGQRSFDKVRESVEKARNTTLVRLIYSLGIANIGLSNAKMLVRQFDYDLDKLLSATVEEMTEIDGIGEVIANSFAKYFAKEENRERFKRLLAELHIQEEKKGDAQILEGKNFVVTGSVEHFTNRNAVKEWVESLGGKVTGSVTGKTNYLINNDNQSNSSKNKKAKELGIPIITEEEFIQMTGWREE